MTDKDVERVLTRKGGDVQQAPSRSDESAVGASRDAQPPTGDPGNG
jgi:hypothetical protein